MTRITATMITVLVNENNPISQDFYDCVIHSLQIHRIFCSCGHAGCLHIHGYYKRSVKTPAGTMVLRILRLKCTECSHTHAVLLSSIVPYSQIPLNDQRQIVAAYEAGSDRNAICNTNSSIDENNIKYVIRGYYRHWRERLHSERIGLFPAAHLIRLCFAVYSAQFMQIHTVFNRLFSMTTQPYPTS